MLKIYDQGTGAKELLNHVVTINADQWTQHDLVRNRALTGEIVNVHDSIYDLRSPTQLTSKRMFKVPGGGYNHTLCINSPRDKLPYQFQAR